jgi:hypothetical protein
MPAVSKAQQRFMGMVHATQKGDMESPSPEVSKAADSMSDKDAKDFASTSHKGLPDKKTEQLNRLREIIRRMVREGMIEEISGSDAAGDYLTPFAFTKPGGEKAKAKKQADLTGYDVVSEEHNITTGYVKGADRIKYKPVATPKGKEAAKDKELAKVSDAEVVTENRWLELKREVSTPTAKIGKGISNMNKQLAEMERFLGWYGKIKNENGVTNENFWKRTNNHIYKIKERLIKLEQQIRKIGE